MTDFELMQKKRMLIVGGSSLLGYKLLDYANDFELYSTYNKNPIYSKDLEAIKINITLEIDCKKILELKPDIIVNTAAMTNVDYCEEHKEDAYNVNVRGAQNLANIAQHLGSKFIHISSDAIFSGGKNSYTEDHEPNPMNVYGKTKLESENVSSIVSNCLILRPSVIFGFIPPKYNKTQDDSVKSMNFAMWVLKKLNEKQMLQVVDDQYNTPTFADNLAENILEMAKKDLKGVFHLSGLSCISRLDFSRKIAKMFGYSYDLITPCSSRELKQSASRSLQACLNCDKIINNGFKLLEIDEAIEIMFKQIKKEQPELVGIISEKHSNFGI